MFHSWYLPFVISLCFLFPLSVYTSEGCSNFRVKVFLDGVQKKKLKDAFTSVKACQNLGLSAGKVEIVSETALA